MTIETEQKDKEQKRKPQIRSYKEGRKTKQKIKRQEVIIKKKA